MTVGSTTVPFEQVLVVLANDEYRYEKWGPSLANDLVVSRIIGRAEAAINENLRDAWETGKVEGGPVYAFGTCLLPGVAGGRNGIRYTHVVLSAEGSELPLIAEALEAAYEGNIIRGAERFYSQGPDGDPRSLLTIIVSKFDAMAARALQPRVSESAQPSSKISRSKAVSARARPPQQPITAVPARNRSLLWLSLLAGVALFLLGAGTGAGLTLFLRGRVARPAPCAPGHECICKPRRTPGTVLAPK